MSTSLKTESVGEREGVRMRPMDEGDLARVTEIEARSFSNPWKEETFRGLLGRADAELWVAEVSDAEASHGASHGDDSPAGGVVGYVVLWFAADEGELADLAVAREYRGRGIGSLLLSRALELAEAHETRSLFLEVRASNGRAVALYQSRGFRVITVRRSYYRKPTEDALVMRRSL